MHMVCISMGLQDMASLVDFLMNILVASSMLPDLASCQRDYYWHGCQTENQFEQSDYEHACCKYGCTGTWDNNTHQGDNTAHSSLKDAMILSLTASWYIGEKGWNLSLYSPL
jgi:hypothetical protein